MRNALLCALALALPLSAQSSKDTSFGTWPFLVGNMDPQIPTLVATAVANDLDTIYVNAFRSTGPSAGTLYITDVAGTWNAAWGPVRPGNVGIDLAALVRLAHAAGVQVVAVVKCFDDTVQPDDAAHRAYLLSVIDYLLNSFDAAGRPVYDLDGVALDYIRWVSSGCTGRNPQLVTDFCRDVKGLLGTRTLCAYLIANRYTFQGPSYTGPFASYSTVISTFANCYGQHWEQMARWVDVLMPMAYTANGSIYSTYAQHQAYVRQAAAYARTAAQRGGAPAARVVPAIRCWSDSSETATTQTIDASIAGALAGGGDGYHAFRYGTMQAAWWPVLKQYAAPGPDRPTADLQVLLAGLTADADPSSSRSLWPSSALQARFDWNNDGVFETAWLPLQAAALLAAAPGAARLGVQVRDPDGHTAGTVRALSLPNPLSLDHALLSAALPVNLHVSLDVGRAGAGAGYLAIAGLSGSSPGTAWGPGVMPLNFDALSFGLLGIANSLLFQSAFGVLDAQGHATATLALPAGTLAPIVQTTMTWAGVGADAFGNPAFVTNPVALPVLR